jgi:hypothetical protein
VPTRPDISKGEGFIRSYELLEELRGDALDAYAVLDAQRGSQFLRRNVVRAVFSYIDALIEIIKLEVRSTLRLEGSAGTLSEREVEFLGGQAITPLVKDQRFLPLEESLKLTFKVAAKVWGLADFWLETDDQEYRDLLVAKDARNRLTHPKTYYDIQVTDEDMRCHTVAFYWITEGFKRLFDRRVQLLMEHLPPEDRDSLRDEIENREIGA